MILGIANTKVVASKVVSILANCVQVLKVKLLFKELVPLSSFKKHGYIVASSGS